MMASEADTPKNLDFPATTAVLNSPDNLAQDALGNIYIIEDAPNRSDVGGDIWFIRDVNGDGVAESLDHFLSLQVDGAESTGMIFNPAKPTQFVVAVQHPDSTNLTNVPDGFGDALWLFDIAGVVAPSCADKDDDDHHHHGKRSVKTCSNSNDANFVKKLKKAAKKDHDDD
jgi:secreted PhoX family phosphatase